MKFYRTLNFISTDELEAVLGEWEEDQRQQKVIFLTHSAGYEITNSQTFFDAVLNSFPLNPPKEAIDASRWDDIQDSVRGGLWGLEEQLVDIVWLDVHDVASSSVPTLIEGTQFLLDAVNSFTEKRWGTNSRIRLIYTYHEEHPNFSTGFWIE